MPLWWLQSNRLENLHALAEKQPIVWATGNDGRLFMVVQKE
jgi:hypothetical protein